MLLKLSIFDFYGQRSDRKKLTVFREKELLKSPIQQTICPDRIFFTSEMRKNIHVAITQQMRISLLFPLNRFSSFHFHVMGIYSVFRLGRELKCFKRVSSHINVIKFQHDPTHRCISVPDGSKFNDRIGTLAFFALRWAGLLQEKVA